LGKNLITKLKLRVHGNTETYQDTIWNGILAPLNTNTITLDTITLSTTENLTVSILEVNGITDTFQFKNNISRTTTRRKTTALNWIVDVTTDAAGHETYWQISNASDSVLYSGGNLTVGSNGGGLGLASPGDPGAYTNGFHSIVQAPMPGYGCYKLLLVDDGGNGMNFFGFGQPTPFLRIRNNQVGIITGASGNFGSAFLSNIEIATVSGTENPDKPALEMVISPNPVSDLLRIQFSDAEFKPDLIQVINTFGQIVKTANSNRYEAENYLEVDGLANGLYFIQANGGGKTYVSKLMVQK
jgi:hypothetical protein